jgi:hypothetical protein
MIVPMEFLSSQEGHEEEEAQARWRHPWLLNTLYGLTYYIKLYNIFIL